MIEAHIVDGFHVQGYVDGKLIYSSKKLRGVQHAGRVKAYWLKRIAKQIRGGRKV
jgi:hypothetical protein